MAAGSEFDRAMRARSDERLARPFRLAPARVGCEVCGKILLREAAIAPEAASALVFLCSLACHEAWRAAGAVADRLACQGEDFFPTGPSPDSH